MDLTRLVNEEKRRADVATVKAHGLQATLDEATGQVLQLESFQTALRSEPDRLKEELGTANERIALLESDLAHARSQAADVDVISAERDNAKELLVESLAVQEATDRDLTAKQNEYDEVVAYFNQTIGDSMRVVMCSCKKEFHRMFPSKPWPTRKLIHAVLKGLNRYNAGVPNPVDYEEDDAFRDAERLNREVVAEDAEYIATERQNRGLPDEDPIALEAQSTPPTGKTSGSGSVPPKSGSGARGKGTAP